MSKTTAHTFFAAALLMVAFVSIHQYAASLDNRFISPAEEHFAIYDAYNMRIDSWEEFANLIGLLAFSVTIAGALLWDKDLYPPAPPSSILGLEERAGRQIYRRARPQKSLAAAEIRIDESRACLDEDESLTPLERVIRGY